MGVRERHATGTDLQTDWHKHAVVKANRTHRWRAVTQYLENFGIFTHATAHYPAYAVALRYLVLPSAKKPRGELDAEPSAAVPLRIVLAPSNAGGTSARAGTRRTRTSRRP